MSILLNFFNKYFFSQKNTGYTVCKDSNVPIYGTKVSAGADVFANETYHIKSGEIVKVKLGLQAAPPKGCFFLINGRSSGFIKGLLVMPGIIDPDYTGEIAALVHNMTDETIEVPKMSRVAQLVCLKYRQANYRIVDKLPTTQRGSGGFGSTGK